MSKSKDLVSEFTAVGQLLDFVIKDGYKIKYLRLVISEREYWIKLSKEIRKNLDPAIKPGAWLEVSGTSKRKSKTGILKLKAEEVRLLDTAPVKTSTSKKAAPKTKVLVCEKSNCWKKGGKAVCQMLEEKLAERGLADQVKIKRTGCLKQCKKGPNLVVMPDKTRYTHVIPKQVPGLIEKHFSSL